MIFNLTDEELIYEKDLFNLIDKTFPKLEGNKIWFVLSKKYFICKRTENIYMLKFKFNIIAIDGSLREFENYMELKKNSTHIIGNLFTPYYDKFSELIKLLEVEHRKLKIKRLLNDTKN